jgi:hypothetical protein
MFFRSMWIREIRDSTDRGDGTRDQDFAPANGLDGASIPFPVQVPVS